MFIQIQEFLKLLNINVIQNCKINVIKFKKIFGSLQ